MSVDYTRGSGAEPARTDPESSVFAPTPVWDRRGGARSLFTDNAATAEEAEREAAMSPNGDRPFMERPAERTVVERRSSFGPAAVVVAVIVLAALAFAGWYAMRTRDNGLAQMTPGAPAGTTPATAVAPDANTAAVAANTPPPTAAVPAPAQTVTEERRTTTTSVTATTARRRTAHRTAAVSPERSVTSPSATGAGVNASAALQAPAPPPVRPSGMSASPSTLAPSSPTTAAPPPIAPSTTPSETPQASVNPASPTPPGDASSPQAAPQ